MELAEDIVQVFCSVIRSVLEYACLVWHPGLTKKLSREIESIQKRCRKLIYPTMSYSQVLIEARLDRLDVRRETITKILICFKTALLNNCVMFGYYMTMYVCMYIVYFSCFLMFICLCL